MERFDLLSGDTAVTPDCGKTSASRQTLVTGKAAQMAGMALRRAILKLAGACDCASILVDDGGVTVRDGNRRSAGTPRYALGSKWIRDHQRRNI